MKIYIAAHDQQQARKVADMLKRHGHTITSTWLDHDMKPSHHHDEVEKEIIAISDTNDVRACDTLLHLASLTRVPGGKHVETGVAMALNKDVHIIGHRENMLLWHPDIQAWDSIEDFIIYAENKKTQTI